MEKVKIKGLKKYYGDGIHIVKALDEIDMVVNDEFLAILGTSGSGKTTLLNMIGGLDQPTEGEIWVEGINLSELRGNEKTIFRRRKIGFIFQAYNLLPMLTAYENIILPLRLDNREINKEFIDSIITSLGLNDKMSRFPYELSGGQQQRIAIARALAIKPSIILADEPTGNLDSKTSKEVIELLKSVSHSFKQTVIMITHNEQMAIEADKIIRIEDGRLLA